MGVSEKLLAVQGGLKAPKSQHNAFGDFNYRSCEDILEALKPLLQQAKAILTIGDEVLDVGGRFYIKATATFQDVETGEQISSSAYAREPDGRPKMDVAQVTGSSSSYARKYALNGMFCIDDAKDPDTQDNRNQGQKPAASQEGTKQGRKPAAGQGGTGQQESRITAEYLDKLMLEAGKKDVDFEKIYSRYGKHSLAEMTSADYVKAMSALSRMPDKFPERAPDNFLNEQQAMEFGEMPFR